ncbi:MAG: OprD family outer membrane porin, partial [Campylobacterota bacterium]|nr:OprD family outer membrane porin [Campylobacterota bacterium]
IFNNGFKMIDMIYLAQADEVTPAVIEQKTTAMQQSGMIHSKVAGRFEVVKTLPKKADDFDSMFDYADAFGKFRLAYINSAHKISANPDKVEKSASSFGGEFGFNTAELHGLQLHIAAYVSQGLTFLNPDKNDLNEDFFGRNLESFAYIAEASIDYNSDIFQTRVGRVKVETPYANSDDIRMAPNTFEGAWANIDYSDNLNTQLLYFKRWAGYDSQDEGVGAFQNKFKYLVDDQSFGMAGASLTYKYAKNSELSFWYNYIDNMSAIAYAEIIGIYFIDGEELHLDYGFQASNIQELDNSNVDGNVLGTMAILHYKGSFIGGAYNLAQSDEGNYVTNGFGGGPYYTSLDEATISAISEGAATSGISASNNNAEAFRIGTGYEFENISLDGLVLELVYGELYNDNGRITEKDAIVTYDITDRWYLEATYTNYESSCTNNTFDRALVRLDYTF